MIKVNEYFNGRVKSLSFVTEEGRATAGVISPGEYEFGTDCVEIMQVTAGTLEVQRPGEKHWLTYGEKQQFEVAAKVTFKVRCKTDVSYVCLYR